MAKPRRKQEYTPALLENLRFRFEQTEESVVEIARSVSKSHTTLRTLARDLGWTKYQPPPLDLTPAARLAAEAGQFAAEAGQFAAEVGRRADASSTLSPRSGGKGRLDMLQHGEAGWGLPSKLIKRTRLRALRPPPPTPPRRSLRSRGEGRRKALRRPTSPLQTEEKKRGPR
jgi:hypothetical protein